jgi:hypothetical protein
VKLDNDVSIVQWMFDTEFLINTFGCPIDCQQMADTIRDLHRVSKQEPGDPTVVCETWKALQKIIGPKMMGQFIATHTWRDLCPEPADLSIDTPSVATLWYQDGKRVVARVDFTGDRATGVFFSVE